MSTERRKLFRIQVAPGLVRAVLGGTARCTVLDISQAGFAVWSHVQLAIGDRVTVRLSYGRATSDGVVRVRTAQRLTSGHFRYGYELEAGQNQLALAQMLKRIVMHEQRRLLRERQRSSGKSIGGRSAS